MTIEIHTKSNIFIAFRVVRRAMSDYYVNMKKLNHLTIMGDFTDAGLRHLEGLKTLSFLTIYSANNFSTAAVQRLKSKLPNLTRFVADQDRAIKEALKKQKPRLQKKRKKVL